jgi:hypothetical protein
MTGIRKQVQDAMKSLCKSVHDLLNKGKRLDQHAVIGQDERITHIFDEERVGFAGLTFYSSKKSGGESNALSFA